MVTLRTGQPCSGGIMGIRYNLDRPRTWISINSAPSPTRRATMPRCSAYLAIITCYVENATCGTPAAVEYGAARSRSPLADRRANDTRHGMG